MPSLGKKPNNKPRSAGSADSNDDSELLEREADAAGAEAAEIGGEVPTDTEDPAQQPLIEGGEGEAEGFELAEKQLEDIASHGDQHRFPDRDAPAAEEREEAERGEADSALPPDT